jgi:hypothetical protein
VQLKCDQLAESPDDPAKSGPGVRLDQINTGEAHSVCQEAATRQAWRPRYQFLFGRVLEAEGNLRDAAKWYSAAADRGEPEACVNLGYLYSRSQPPNYAAAAELYQKAVWSGSAKGALMLGWLYHTGNGVQQNPAEAMRLYTDAGNRGQTDAMYRLGLMCEDGDGVVKDPGVAAQWFYEAARRGHAYAQEELGWMFATGTGVSKPDHRAAFAWFLPAARAGLMRSQTAVASEYDIGQVVEKNPSEAVEWYRKAAAQNETFAMYQLGVHLRRGDGVAWSESQAMQWFKKAGDNGLAAAEYAVGYGYENGLGQDVGQGRQDYRQAADWLTRAAQHGDDSALIELAWLYQKGWGVERNLPRAKSLYQQASNSSYPNIAEFARNMGALLEDDRDEVAQTSSGQPEKSSGLVPLVVIGLGILALGTLFSGPSGHGGGGGAPVVAGDPSGSGLEWPTSTSAPRTPTCRQVPDSIGSSTPNGLALSNGGSFGASHLECD